MPSLSATARSSLEMHGIAVDHNVEDVDCRCIFLPQVDDKDDDADDDKDNDKDDNDNNKNDDKGDAVDCLLFCPGWMIRMLIMTMIKMLLIQACHQAHR